MEIRVWSQNETNAEWRPRDEGLSRWRKKEKGRNMKLMAQLAVIGALVTGATALNAQNIDNTITVSLNGVVQTGDNTSARGHAGTKDVIQALVPGASAKARLLLRNTVGGGQTFIVKDGDTETDVSGAFSTARVGTAVTVTTTRGDVNTDKTTEIREFALSTGTLSFDVQGYTTSTSNNKGLHGEVFDDTFPVQATAKVAGTITDTSGNPGVVQGTITVGNRKITETP